MMDAFATRTKLVNDLHEGLLFAPSLPTVERITLKKLFIDAVKRELHDFKLSNFLEPDKWSQLTHLYLARNALIELPDELFYQAENLEWLDLRWNELRKFPTSVRNHSSLKTILLQENHLAVLPIEMGSLERLQCLSVSNNPLEFPTPDILSKCRTNTELINYLRKCWKAQSIDVPLSPPQSTTKLKRKKAPKKMAPLSNVKDYTEVICRLRNSGKIRDQIKAEKMLQRLDFERKLVQSFRDQDVLKKWRDKYKESQGTVSRTGVRFTDVFSQLLRESEHQTDQTSREYLTRDVDSTINELQKQIQQSYISNNKSMELGTDPLRFIQEKSRQIENMRDIKKKITYLKQYCGN